MKRLFMLTEAMMQSKQTNAETLLDIRASSCLDDIQKQQNMLCLCFSGCKKGMYHIK